MKLIGNELPNMLHGEGPARQLRTALGFHEIT